MTRTELETLIGQYLHRTDLTGQIPGFIDLATRRIGRMLRSKSNEVLAQLVVTANPTALPADFASMRSISQGQSGGPVSIVPSSQLRFNQFARVGAGTSVVYNIQGKFIEFAPLGAGTYDLDYFAVPAELTSGASTNGVLTDLPYLYLYASLVEANIFIQDPEMSNQMLGIFMNEVEDENRLTSKSNAGDLPAVVGV